MKKWIYLVGTIGAVVIIPIIGMYILGVFFKPAIVTSFYILYVAVVWVGGFFLTRNSENFLGETLPPTTPIPEDLQETHNKLLSLGFKLIGEMRVQYFFKKQTQWAYFNQDRSVVAYTHNFTWARVWFSSYFEDGFDVTTYHEHGDNLDTKKLIKRVVKKSISSALDYHIHHTYQHSHKHGNLMRFVNLEKHLEWMSKQSYGKEESKGYIKEIVRTILAVIIIPLATVIIGGIIWGIYLVIASPATTELPDVFVSVILMISGILLIGWIVYPLLWPKTVESRKKRKAKEGEATTVAQEDIYPF